MQYFKHLRSDSGADRTYHARDMVGRARASIKIEINIWASPIFHIRFRPLDRRDAVSRVEMGLPAQKNGLKRLVRRNIYSILL